MSVRALRLLCCCACSEPERRRRPLDTCFTTPPPDRSPVVIHPSIVLATLRGVGRESRRVLPRYLRACSLQSMPIGPGGIGRVHTSVPYYCLSYQHRCRSFVTSCVAVIRCIFRQNTASTTSINRCDGSASFCLLPSSGSANEHTQVVPPSSTPILGLPTRHHHHHHHRNDGRRQSNPETVTVFRLRDPRTHTLLLLRV